MEMLQLRLRLGGIESPEVALVELQQWLQDAGIRAELERLPPTEEELGGKVVAVILICGLLNESIGEALHGVHDWQQHHPKAPPVHIELHEPEQPPKGSKEQVIAPPPKPPLKKG